MLRTRPANVGAFSAESLTLVPFDGLRGKYIASRNGFNVKNWAQTSKTNYRRTLRTSFIKGEQITFKHKKTNQINSVATVGPGRGKARIYVDGVNKCVIDTKGAKTKHRQVVFTIDIATFGTHSIKIVNLGTAGRPIIEIDGIAVRR